MKMKPELNKQLVDAAKCGDIDKVKELVKVIRQEEHNLHARVDFVLKVESLGPHHDDEVMFTTMEEVNAIHEFLKVMTEQKYSIYDPDGNEVMHMGEWY